MPEYVPSPVAWVREQVEAYERTNGAEGATLRDTGLPVIIVTHRGNKTGHVRKTPLMRVKDGASYVLVASQGGAPKDPVWVHNLRADPSVEIRDVAAVFPRAFGKCETTPSATGCGRSAWRPSRRTSNTRTKPLAAFQFS